MLTLFISYAIIQLASSTQLPPNVQYFTERKNWFDAESFCEERGGHLISIHDDTTNSQIADYILEQYPNTLSGYAWIGLNRQTNTWTDNSPYDYTAQMTQGEGVCTAMLSYQTLYGIWADPPCNNTYPFFCQDETVETKTCNKDTDISNFGNILCHYSSVNADGGFTGSKWFDISGNGNDLEVNKDFFGLNYLGTHGGLNEDYVSNNPTNGYIKFPTACNLASNGDYTLFTASMYYGLAPQGSRAFGNCLDNTFVSGWFQQGNSPQNPNTSPNYDWQIFAYRDGYQLLEENYNINGWAIISDTMNSMRLNGREITHEIPIFDSLGNNDIQICFNYVNGASTNAPYRIKEYIVFDETLDNDERRCVEEYIFDKHDFWQHLTGLAPKQN